MEDYSLNNEETKNTSSENLEISNQNLSNNEEKQNDKKIENSDKKEKNNKEIFKLLNEDITNNIEINIIKLTKISNKLSEINSKENAEEIKFLKDIEKDYANIFGVKLTKSQKDLLIKYVK